MGDDACGKISGGVSRPDRQQQAVGEAFHITSDEVLSWNQIYQTIAEALGVEANIVHIASDFLAQIVPRFVGSLLGDKTWSVVFDNSKIEIFVPGFEAVISFREGTRRTAAWLDEREGRRRIDEALNEEIESILKATKALSMSVPEAGAIAACRCPLR